MSRARRFMPAAALVAAGLCLTAWAMAGSVQEALLQARLRTALAAELPTGVRVGTATLLPVVRVQAPGSGLDAVAVRPGPGATEEGALHLAPVVLGVMGRGPLVVAGHRDRHFAALAHLAVGDAVLVSGPLRHGRHVVDRVLVVDAADTSAVASLDETALVLLTCFPFDHLGPAPQRCLVVLRPAGTLAARGIRSNSCCSARRERGSGTSRPGSWASA